MSFFMKALKIILLLFIVTFFTKNVSCQYYYHNDKYYNTDLFYEVGISAGMMNSITDIGGANTDNAAYFNEIRKKNNKFSKGIYAAVLYQNILGARLEGTLGEVSSDDSTITGKSNNIYSKYIRNLSFRSKISEVCLLVELHPLAFLNFEIAPDLSPYILAGVGVFHFNPQAKLNGNYIDLKPLHTEGQGFDEYPDRKPYSLTQFNIPIGVGVKYEMARTVNVRLEFLHRRLFTDYLDDASTKNYIDPALFSKYLSPQDAANANTLHNRSRDGSIPIFRGHSQNNDVYMTLSLKVGIVIGRESNDNSAWKKHLKCTF